MTLRAAIEVLLAFLRPDAVIALRRVWLGSKWDAAEISSSESIEASIDFFSLVEGVAINKLSSAGSRNEITCGTLSAALASSIKAVGMGLIASIDALGAVGVLLGG